ncbi:MAG: HD domain-containing phosphohydrolase [Chitinophagales bacterium]
MALLEKEKAFTDLPVHTTQEQLRRSQDALSVLNALLKFSLEETPLQTTLVTALELVSSIKWLSEKSSGGIFLVENDSDVLQMAAVYGKVGIGPETCNSIRAGECLCGKAALNRQIEFSSDLDIDPMACFGGVGPHGHYCIPILSNGYLLGVITLNVQEGHSRSREEDIFLQAVADTLAGLIVRKRAEEDLKKSVSELRQVLDGTVAALAACAEKRDPYTAGHQQRVAELGCEIAIEMGISEEIIQSIRVAGTLHDIGKIVVPSEILTKPGELIEAEMTLIRLHPEAGFDILKTIPFGSPVAEIALQHHERLDGSGYPYRLSGDDILMEARILMVADVIEAMSSHRPYRPALGIWKAIDYITDNSGKLFDKEVVTACVRLLKRKHANDWVI